MLSPLARLTESCQGNVKDFTRHIRRNREWKGESAVLILYPKIMMILFLIVLRIGLA